MCGAQRRRVGACCGLREGFWTLVTLSVGTPGPSEGDLFCYLLLLVLPQKPVYGYLGAKDGQEEGEGAVLQVVAVGGVDDEGARDGEGRDDKEEGNAEHGDAEGPADGAVTAGVVARRGGGAGPQGGRPLFPGAEKKGGGFS